MPCWEVTMATIELTASDRDLLEQALKELGIAYERDGTTFYLNGLGLTINEAEVEGRESQGFYDAVNAIKRQYGIESTKKSYEDQGWVVEFSGSGWQTEEEVTFEAVKY